MVAIVAALLTNSRNLLTFNSHKFRFANMHASAKTGVHKGWVLLALCLAALVINVDVTIVNVALPSLVRELGATTTNLQWIVDAYTLVFAALILAAGSVS